VFVSRCVHVVNGKVALHFSLVNREEEVLASDNFCVGIRSEDLTVDLFLKFNKLEFLFNDAVNAIFDFLDGLGIIGVDDLRFEGLTVLVLILKAGEVSSFSFGLLSLHFSLLGRVFPQRHSGNIASVSLSRVDIC
jgi:hypothetical protein